MTDASEQSALVERARAGDAEAFGVLVRRYQNAAYAIALSHVRRAADAEDVVQEAFVAAWCKLGQLRDTASFTGWLRRIVAAESLQWLRRRRREGAVACLEATAQSLVTESGSPETRMSQHSLWSHVYGLPEHYRTAALLYYLSGFSYDEIARFLEVPVTTVKGRLQQARIRLKETLSPEEWKEIAMSQTDVSDEVQELIYQIATQRIHETVSLAGIRNAVLFLGVTASIEIRQAAGTDLVIEGSRTSMGLSIDAARRSAESILVQVDRVVDYGPGGPHPGETFHGTSSIDKSKPIAESAPATDTWVAFRDRIGERIYGLRTSDAFSELADAFNPVHDDLWPALRDAARISIQREKMEALTLPRSLYTEHLASVFHANYEGDEYMQGPVGRVDATVYVPVGTTLTVINAEAVSTRGVEANLFVVDGHGCDIEGARGAIRLLNTPLERAVDLKGSLYQCFHSYGGVSFAGERARRNAEFRSTLESITGEVEIDVGRVHLEASRLSGNIRLRNRHGDTRLEVDEILGDSHFSVDSTSGAVHVGLAKGLLSDLTLTALTICGTVDYTALRGLGSRRIANTGQLTFVSSMPGNGRDLLSADLVVKTESGDIAFQVYG